MGSSEIRGTHGRGLNATAASLLGFLHDGPRTGWQLTAEVETRLGAFWSITRSQVYRELKRLSQDGLVDAGSAGARDAQPFAITDEGRAAFQEWTRAGPGPGTVRLPLLLYVSLAEHIDHDLLRSVLGAQLAHQTALLEGYRELLAEQPPENLSAVATLEFGIATAEVTIAWLQRWRDRFGPPTVE